MSQERKEQLFDMLFDVLSELTEHESPDIIFDRIVEDFAYQAEYYMGQAQTFTSMLDTFRHELPEDYVPDADADAALDEILDATTPVSLDDLDFSVTTNPPRPEELYGGISDINRQYMLEDRDNLMEFLKSAHFPDRLDP